MDWMIALIPLLPGASSLVLALFGRVLPRPAVSWIACGSVFGSLAVAAAYLAAASGVAVTGFGTIPVEATLFRFLDAGPMQVDMAFRLDTLSLLMCLVVTGVGFLIHVYSVGYMHHEDDYARYFCYLNLFTFFMLILVLGANLVVLFIGWEGVGLCSYLLIGFWYHKRSATDAGKKAFIVNRIGDAGFLVGMMLIYAETGTLSIQEIVSHAERLPVELAALSGLCLFIGATGKSAQIPLYVWLPDAMEGPTPVSALIHAATMVTSGVYMVARLGALYSQAPQILALIAWVGALTAIFAATIGTVQNDIKRVLAYSTISQLGYMFLGCGVAAYDAAVFHLYTHAFFKALLFLGAGSVIHAMAGEQDIRAMGGLSKKLPVTAWTFAAGTLAIAGVPLFSGFFSKDLILERAFEANVGLWAVGILTAALTAFYMFRLLNLTFFGITRVAPGVHPHESPPSMTVPLSLLAIGSVAAGYFPVAAFLRQTVVVDAGHAAAGGAHGLLAFAAVSVMAIGWLLAYHLYIKETSLPGRMVDRYPRLYTLLSNKYYVDEIYDAAVVRPLVRGSEMVYDRLDLGVIDRTLDRIGAGALGSGRIIAALQTGNIKAYALSMLAGIVALLALWVL